MTAADIGAIAVIAQTYMILRGAVIIVTSIRNADGPTGRLNAWTRAINDDRHHPVSVWLARRIVTAKPDDETRDWPKSRA
jgi:hypothetical protein